VAGYRARDDREGEGLGWSSCGLGRVGGTTTNKNLRTDVSILSFILAPILALVRLVVRIVIALLRAVTWILNTLVNGLGRVAEVTI